MGKTKGGNPLTSVLISDIKALIKAPVLAANVLPVFAGFWLALHFSHLAFMEHFQLFLILMLGSTLVMAGALVINNWFDADIDQVMDRTKKRPTVTGTFSLKSVLATGVILTLLGFGLLLKTTVDSLIYAFIGWFTYVFLYTMWSKRRYTFNTIIGSVSGAVTPLIGWASVNPDIQGIPLIMTLILFIWQMPHTYMIAMKKYHEYKAAKVAMLPVVRGFEVTKRHTFLYIVALVPLPFFMPSLGISFIVLATLLNIGWLVLSVIGFFVKNDDKWARISFLYSVNYLMIIFVCMVLVTL